MSQPSNPYEASKAELPVPEDEAMPPAVLAVLVCYLAHGLLEVIPLFATPMAEFELFMPSMATVILYLVAMCFALWRRQQWARVWLVLTTVIAVVLLGRMLWRGLSVTQWPAVLAQVLRMAVAAMLFLPSVRRWFTPRTLSSNSTPA